MQKLLIVVSVAGFFGVAMAFLEVPVLADKDEDEKGEQEISFKDLPGPIKRALKDLKVGQVSEIERERRGSRTVYEVELRVGKQEVELRLNPDGKLLGVEIEQRADDDDDDDDDR